MWPSAAFAGFKLPVKSFTALVEIIMMPVANSELENLKPASDLDSEPRVTASVTVLVTVVSKLAGEDVSEAACVGTGNLKALPAATFTLGPACSVQR